MRKNLILLMIFVLAVPLLTFLFKNIIDELFDNDVLKKMLVSSLKIFSAGVFFYLATVKKMSVLKLNKNYGLAFLGIALVILSFIATNFKIKDQYPAITDAAHYSYLFNCLSVGFFEELICRVLIFSVLVKLYKSTNNTLYLGEVVFASAIFAVLHLFNLFNPDFDFYGVMTQVISAFIVGLLLQSLLINTRNIWFNGMLHCLLNYWGMRSGKLFKVASSLDGNSADDFYSSLIFMGFACIILFPVCFLLLNVDRKRRLKET